MADTNLAVKVRKTTEKISENVHIIANEPSMALYRIQEHVRKVIPPIVEKRSEVFQLQNELNGCCYDMEYALGAVKSFQNAENSFNNIHELLKNAIFLKQQLKYESTRRIKRELNQNSVYKRFSAHIALDLPDLSDISDVVRETTNKVENMMPTSKPNNPGTSTELQRSRTTLH